MDNKAGPKDIKLSGGGGGGGDTGVPISHIPEFLGPISHIPVFLPPNIPYPRFHSQFSVSQILQDANVYAQCIAHTIGYKN